MDNQKSSKINIAILAVLVALLFVVAGESVRNTQSTPGNKPVGGFEYNPVTTVTNSSSTVSSVTINRVVATSTSRQGLEVVNQGANDVYLCQSDFCAVNTGILLKASGGSWTMDPWALYMGSITAIASSTGSSTLTIAHTF